MNNSWLTHKNGLSLNVSLIIHIFMVMVTYFVKLSTIDITYNHNHKKNGQYALIRIMPQKMDTVEQSPLMPCTISKKDNLIKYNKKYVKQKIIAPKNIANSHKFTPKIDQRAVYNNTTMGSKKTGAILELSGWKWDMVPNPQDTTEEFGKIVFEIKVDENGEIISLRSIEKTVSPLVEKIYLDALRDLTFSKTSTKPCMPISTGKITFILVPK